MRLGKEDEAKAAARRGLERRLSGSWRRRIRSTLLNSYKNYDTFKTPTTILKLNKKEAALLRPYFQAELDRIIATYEKKYKYKLTARCRWKPIRTTKISRCAPWACRDWARWA